MKIYTVKDYANMFPPRTSSVSASKPG